MQWFDVYCTSVMDNYRPMACFQMTRPKQHDCNKWYFNDYKLIKVFGTNDRIAFHRKGNHYTRGVTLSKDAFLNIIDVTITPGMKVELEPNVFLSNLGKRIQLIKYCLTRDNKRCDGGFFYFTLSEWQYFLNKLRPAIMERLSQ